MYSVEANSRLLTVTEFKMSFQKCQPHIITYRNYKIVSSLDLKFKTFVL